MMSDHESENLKLADCIDKLLSIVEHFWDNGTSIKYVQAVYMARSVKIYVIRVMVISYR